jgi:alkylation response protein AidB-like acyl-CoA dehydrogenase
MPVALDAEFTALHDSVRALLASADALATARAALERDEDLLPPYWEDLGRLGYLSAHLPPAYGGAADLRALVAVLEATGRAAAPGPTLPGAVVAAVLARHASPALAAEVLPELAQGKRIAAIGLRGGLTRDASTVHGDAGAVLGSSLADLLLLRCGDDLVLVDAAAPGVVRTSAPSIDKGLRVGRVRLDGVAVDATSVLTGAAPTALALLRLAAAAEAVGGAQRCLELAVAYAKTREQFGRVIGSFQAIKHHCSAMRVMADLATASLWDAVETGEQSPEQFRYLAAVAASVALRAYRHNAQLAIQVHGAIGFAWEHDLHLYLRRALLLETVTGGAEAARTVTELAGHGVRGRSTIALPAEVEAQRDQVRADLDRLRDLAPDQLAVALADSGYAAPHLPRPWGLGASPGLQLLIEEELQRASIEVEPYGITGWIIATLIQYGRPDQIDRWVRPALQRREIWCQLFSEPGAGSDAASIRTYAVRDGDGWIVQGQKTWTSGAHRCRYGLATVRTDPDSPLHGGITMMVIDLSRPGVTVRPLRQITGESGFNEVFLDGVRVDDAEVIGQVGRGWDVARATLGSERLSIGKGLVGDPPADEEVLAAFAAVGRPATFAARVGHLVALFEAGRQLNRRHAYRTMHGEGLGDEGSITKLARVARLQEAAVVQQELLDDQVALAEAGTLGGLAAFRLLNAPRYSIAGGTAEILRNQVAERLLGLPREPRHPDRSRDGRAQPRTSSTPVGPDRP